MPKNHVIDPITDQEIAFAHLVLSGTVTDRRAAEAVGLNPDTAAYTKTKPRVRAYMLEHRAAMEERLVEEEREGLRRRNLGREQVLFRLWEIANLSPEMTRGSVTAQVKALTMIVAIEGLIPDRRTVSSEKNSAPPPAAQIYAGWRGEQQGKTTVAQLSPDPVRDEDRPGVPDLPPGGVADAPPLQDVTSSPIFGSSESAFANSSGSSEATSVAPHVPGFAPDARKPFSIKKNRFGPHR